MHLLYSHLSLLFTPSIETGLLDNKVESYLLCIVWLSAGIVLISKAISFPLFLYFILISISFFLIALSHSSDLFISYSYTAEYGQTSNSKESEFCVLKYSHNFRLFLIHMETASYLWGNCKCGLNYSNISDFRGKTKCIFSFYFRIQIKKSWARCPCYKLSKATLVKIWNTYQ